MDKGLPDRMSGAITLQDAATLDLARMVVEEKVFAFMLAHSDHDPRHCPYADPEIIDAVTTTMAMLRALVDAFNVERREKGKDEFVSFDSGSVRVDEGFDA